MSEEKKLVEELNNLHHKILHSTFCEKVSEAEIEALVAAKTLLAQSYKKGDDIRNLLNEIIKRMDKEIVDALFEGETPIIEVNDVNKIIIEFKDGIQAEMLVNKNI